MNTNINPFSTIPVEMTNCIFSFLSDKDLTKVVQVNKEFNKLGMNCLINKINQEREEFNQLTVFNYSNLDKRLKLLNKQNAYSKRFPQVKLSMLEMLKIQLATNRLSEDCVRNSII